MNSHRHLNNLAAAFSTSFSIWNIFKGSPAYSELQESKQEVTRAWVPMARKSLSRKSHSWWSSRSWEKAFLVTVITRNSSFRVESNSSLRLCTWSFRVNATPYRTGHLPNCWTWELSVLSEFSFSLLALIQPSAVFRHWSSIFTASSETNVKEKPVICIVMTLSLKSSNDCFEKFRIDP